MMNHGLEEEEVIPNGNDVLCGSGNMKAIHPGNQRFRRIVATHYIEYAAATSKADKMKVSRRIMKEVLSAGTRFLKKNTGSDNWYVADLRVGKDKMSHCLRDFRNKGKRDGWAKHRKGGASSSTTSTATTATATVTVTANTKVQHLPSSQVLLDTYKRNHRTPVVVQSMSPPAEFAPPPPRITTSARVQGPTQRKAPVTRQANKNFSTTTTPVTTRTTIASTSTGRAPTDVLLRDVPAPVYWDGVSRSSAAAETQEVSRTPDPLLLEFATAFSDNQQLQSQYDNTGAASSRKVMHLPHHTASSKDASFQKFNPVQRDSPPDIQDEYGSSTTSRPHNRQTAPGFRGPPPPHHHPQCSTMIAHHHHQQQKIHHHSPLYDLCDDGRWMSSPSELEETVSTIFLDWRRPESSSEQ